MESRERGFIITLAMILVFTVVVIGLIVGIAAVRNAWFKKAVFEDSIEVYVVDDEGTVVGKAVDFDEHETPLVPFVDYEDPVPNGTHRRVLLGVRSDRFTSRERLYYTTKNCTLGTACIFEPSTESSGGNAINSQGIDMIAGTGGVSYHIATQGDVNYAIGSTGGGLPGRLYRQTDVACDENTILDIKSFWMSQAVVWQSGTDTPAGADPEPPCYPIEFVIVEEETTAIKCKPGTLVHKGGSKNDFCVGGDEVGIGDPYCRTVTPGGDLATHRCAQDGDANWGGPIQAACPEPDWQLQPPGNASGWCCPPDAVDGKGAGQCQQASNNLPAAGTFFEAESVGTPNVLDGLEAPFVVTLPIRPDGFTTTPPDADE